MGMSSMYPISISTPAEFVLANPVTVGQLCKDDISSWWYILASTRNGEIITTDLQESRRGRCYDSFFEHHGVRGSCPVIANSFFEFLGLILPTRGRKYYWLEESFTPLADAYDL